MHIGRTAGVALATASLAVGIGLSPIPASASGAVTTNVSVTGLVNGWAPGTLTKSTVVNSNWTIVNESLSVSTYGGAWVTTFTYTLKTATGASTTSFSGSVSSVNEYGTSPTLSFGPFKSTGVIDPISFSGSAITADNGNWYGLYYGGAYTLPAPASDWNLSTDPVGWSLMNASYNLAYFTPGGFVAYYFGT
jgi:hypothetical protein